MWFESPPTTLASSRLLEGNSPCTCTARMIVLENLSEMMLQSLFEVASYFGEAQILDTHPVGAVFQSTVAYDDLRDAQRALTGIKTFAGFQNVTITPIVEIDFAITINLSSAGLAQQVHVCSSLSSFGPIAMEDMKPDGYGNIQLMAFYYDKRSTQRATMLRFNNGRGDIQAVLTSVHHSQVCLRKTSRLVSQTHEPEVQFLSPAPFSSSLWSRPVLPTSPILNNDKGTSWAPRSIQTPFGISSPPVDEQVDGKWFQSDKKSHDSFQVQASTPPFNTVSPSIWSPDADDFKTITKGVSRSVSPPLPLEKTQELSDDQRTTCESQPLPVVQPLHGIVTRHKVPSRNVVDLDLIDSGKETRTTVMLRNIPNKFTQKALKEFLDVTNLHTYDFLYLRMDFENHCNVGYAFVSFTHPKHIATFARARCGQKWNSFKSEKLLDLSFAKIQGRGALINKFRTSPVMKETESYRPKLYYTSGPLIGQEEPFPVCKR